MNAAVISLAIKRLVKLGEICATDEKAWCTYVRLSTVSSLGSVYLISVGVAQLSSKRPQDMCDTEAR